MVLLRVCFILVCVVYLDVVRGLAVNECTQGGVLPEEVYIDDCEQDATICQVKFDGIFNMTIKFKAPHYLESMRPSLIGKTALGMTEFKPLTSDDDVCKGITNTICPLVEKELIEYKYAAKLLVMPFLPLTLEFSILDKELNETAICFNLVVSPSRL